MRDVLPHMSLLQEHDDRTLGGEESSEERKPVPGEGRKRARGRGPQVCASLLRLRSQSVRLRGIALLTILIVQVMPPRFHALWYLRRSHYFPVRFCTRRPAQI